LTISYVERFKSPNSIDEAFNKRDDKWTKNYLVHGDAGETELQIVPWLQINLPQTLDDLLLETLKIEREDSDGYWSCDAQYTATSNPKNRPELQPGGGYRMTIRSAGGASVKVLTSLALVNEEVDALYADKWTMVGPLVSDRVRRLLGWRLTSDGATTNEPIDLQVGGVEIGLELSVSAAQVSAGFLVDVASHAAQQAVNSTIWNGFAMQTLRFTNFSATPRNGASPAWDLQYTFDYSPSTTVVFDAGTVAEWSIQKAGQHLIDMVTEYKEVDANDGWFLPFIIRAATHQIRPEINYSTELGI
tara:strand:- start:541 stop:1449 length:909 start_codon:yes stop_codon:yes gene_type:complete